MAKHPKRGLSDADIVRLRDDAAYPDRAQALGSPEARRSLAESRLRALAISLTAKGVAGPQAGVPNDDELLEYLLADMAEDRSRELESRIRGNPHAFERLVKLHELTSAEVNHRDLQHADMAERNLKRHDLGKFEVRMRAGRLAFRRLDDRRAPLDDLLSPSTFAFRMRDAVEPAVENSGDDDTLGEIERLLSRCSELAARVRQLRNAGGGGDPEDLGNLKYRGKWLTAEEELAQTIERLQLLGHTLQREAMMARKLGPKTKGPLRRMKASRAELSPPPDVMRNVMASRSAFFEEAGDRSWRDRVEFGAGPWTMSLAGHAGPVNALDVSVVAARTAAPSEWPFLTIVQPGKSFETADLDSSGRLVLPLTYGHNILMLQAYALWAVHLNFSSSG